MVITYFGTQYCKLTLGDLTIALNPPAKDSKAFGGKAPRFGADIVLVSVHHPDYAGIDTVTLGDKTPFVIDGPGSYEVRDSFFAGAKSAATLEGKAYINSVYGFELDGIKIGVLGACTDESTLSTEAKEILGTSDMLFVPVGDNPVHAFKIATSFEPNVIIPLDYTKESLAKFLKEAGQEKVTAEDKLTLKRRDLDGKQSIVMVLAPQA